MVQYCVFGMLVWQSAQCALCMELSILAVCVCDPDQRNWFFLVCPKVVAGILRVMMMHDDHALDSGSCVFLAHASNL